MMPHTLLNVTLSAINIQKERVVSVGDALSHAVYLMMYCLIMMQKKNSIL